MKTTKIREIPKIWTWNIYWDIFSSRTVHIYSKRDLEPSYKQFLLILAQSKEKLPEKNSTTACKNIISTRKRN